MCSRYTFGLYCREDTCSNVHGVLPLEYIRHRYNFTGRRSPKSALAALTNTLEQLTAVDIIDNFVNGEEKANSQLPQDEEEEHDQYYHLNSRQEEDEIY